MTDAESGRTLVAAAALPCQVYAPVAAPLARRGGLERGQVLVQSPERPALHAFLAPWRAQLESLRRRRVRWSPLQ